MRPRIAVFGLLMILLGAAVVAIAQPPLPSGTLPSVPAQPPLAPPASSPPLVAVPAAVTGKQPEVTSFQVSAGESVLSRFENLASFPTQTQTAVRSVLLAANWLTRMNQSNGRFIYGFNPALRQPLSRDHDLHQARAALAMAQLSKFSGDEKQSAIASQAILTLLASTRLDASDAACRVPVHSSLVCNRVGFAATLALAIYSLPGADAKLLTQAEQLTEFLHKQCRSDGSVHYTDGTIDNSIEADPAGVNEFPGLALHAIAASNRYRQMPWKQESVQAGLAYYQAILENRPNPLLAASLTPAAADLYLQSRIAAMAAKVFELNDMVCRFQIPGNDARLPQCMGGFRTVVNGQQTDVPSGPETGIFLQSLSLARQVARLAGDLDRHAKFRGASLDALHYLSELQFVETNTRHYENSFRANMLIGSFHLSPTDGTIRIDATATAISGILQLLSVAVERD